MVPIQLHGPTKLQLKQERILATFATLYLPRTKYSYFFPIFLLIYKIITIFIPCKTINCMYKYNYKNFEGPFPRWQTQTIYRKANRGNVSHQCMSLKSTSLLSSWSRKSSSDSCCTELVLIIWACTNLCVCSWEWITQHHTCPVPVLVILFSNLRSLQPASRHTVPVQPKQFNIFAYVHSDQRRKEQLKSHHGILQGFQGYWCFCENRKNKWCFFPRVYSCRHYCVTFWIWIQNHFTRYFSRIDIICPTNWFM